MLKEGQIRPNRLVSATLPPFAVLLLWTVMTTSCFAQGKRYPYPIQRTQHSQAESALTLQLQDCLNMALERQPRLAAQRASLAMAEQGKRTLDGMRLAAALDHQIPIRRKQAGLGVTAAAAGLDQAEREMDQIARDVLANPVIEEYRVEFLD